MKAAFTIAFVCLAGLGSGCDAVVGGFRNEGPGQFSVSVGSQNSGADPWGAVTFQTCCPFTLTLEVTCLRVVGNRATIGTKEVPTGAGTRLFYIEDNPGGQDMLDQDNSPGVLTVCPDPPPLNPNYRPIEGDLRVIDDYPPPAAD